MRTILTDRQTGRQTDNIHTHTHSHRNGYANKRNPADLLKNYENQGGKLGNNSTNVRLEFYIGVN